MTNNTTDLTKELNKRDTTNSPVQQASSNDKRNVEDSVSDSRVFRNQRV